MVKYIVYRDVGDFGEFVRVKRHNYVSGDAVVCESAMERV